MALLRPASEMIAVSSSPWPAYSVTRADLKCYEFVYNAPRLAPAGTCPWKVAVYKAFCGNRREPGGRRDALAVTNLQNAADKLCRTEYRSGPFRNNTRSLGGNSCFCLRDIRQ
jgi:hypothetical protein